MATEPFFAIVVEDIDNTQRTLIHELVKKSADDWWHGIPNLWIVKGGGTTGDWRNRLSPIVPLAPAVLLVIALKTTPGGRWATKGPEDLGAWWTNASDS